MFLSVWAFVVSCFLKAHCHGRKRKLKIVSFLMTVTKLGGSFFFFFLFYCQMPIENFIDGTHFWIKLLFSLMYKTPHPHTRNWNSVENLFDSKSWFEWHKDFKLNDNEKHRSLAYMSASGEENVGEMSIYCEKVNMHNCTSGVINASLVPMKNMNRRSNVTMSSMWMIDTIIMGCHFCFFLLVVRYQRMISTVIVKSFLVH